MNKKSILALAMVAGLSACVTVPERPPVTVSAPQPAPTKVYFYPTKGQTEEQQDRDRYECHSWSVRQTGFDPSRRLAAGPERGSIIPARSSGQTIGAAAVAGAVIGAIVAGRGDTLEGAVVGGMAGTVMGSAAASANEAEARRVEHSYSVRADGRYEKKAAEFRRAMSACLDGRGYSVK